MGEPFLSVDLFEKSGLSAMLTGLDVAAIELGSRS